MRKIKAFLILLIVIMVLSACQNEMPETASGNNFASPTYILGEPRETSEPATIQAEIDLRAAMAKMNSLKSLNIDFLTTSGWLHNVTKIIDVYHQYYLDNPNDPSVDVDGEFYTNAVYSPPSQIKESWIELDGHGYVTGNRISLVYDRDLTPLSAFGENFDETTVSIEAIINPDRSIKELILDSDQTFQSADRSVARLDDCYRKVADHFKEYGLFKVDHEEIILEGQNILRIRVENRTAMTLDLSYFPEPIIGFVHTYEFSEDTGHCSLYLQEAVAESGAYFLAYEERLSEYDVFQALPSEMEDFYFELINASQGKKQ
ncbi:MAG TPA: hypothetical protein VFC66_03835 [Anaerolineaceae bacterium]|nr:hypothetical protein [Anaerolineaceae bacterium]